MHDSDSMKMRRVHRERHLEERALIEINLGNPSKPLIELPVNLPTIPVIGSLLAPLITPLIGGPGTTTTAAATTTAATVATQSPTQANTPTTTSSGGSTSNGSNNGGTTSGGTTSGGDTSGSGTSGDNSSGGSGSSNSNGSSTGNNSSGNGSGSASSQSSASGATSPSRTVSPNQSGASSIPSGSNANDTGLPQATTSPNVQAMNVQDDPNVFGNSSSASYAGASTSGSFSSVTRSGSSSQSTSGSGGGSDGGGTDGGGQGTLSTDSGHHGLSKGAIIAIAVVASLLGLVIFFFVARKCYRSKRVARRRRWFQSGNYYSAEPASSGDGYFTQNRISHRSSFGTTYDQGHRPVSPSDVPFDGSWSPPPLPTAPDMTMKDAVSPTVFITVPTAAHPSDHPPSPIIRTSLTESEAASLHSALESQSRSQSQMSQYVTVPDSATLKPGSGLLPDMAFPSPISVRPFSPTESWSFPKPPNDELKRRSDAILSSKQSQSTLRPPPSHSSMDTLSNDDYYTAESQAVNPFADFTSCDSHMTTIHTDPSNEDHFAPVEIIRRPFVPTMSDEMAVAPGDQVRVRRRFDDGWAYAEKLSGNARGLFPIDCLRMQDQDLPAFLAAKRLSSYAGAQPVHAT
ncbi:hypothetical protein QCA50_006772 [Cerrena zonata]|uniref:SH3 domain-containing protein n=1 Tax=Cerrena zonata TaxID=2478898 RepID=A0AAW0GIQ7_9APHY